MLSNRSKDLLGALQAVLRTNDGKKLFKYLQENYVEGSAISDSVEKTYYRLGQKELIQALIKDSKLRDEDFEPIKTISMYEE